MVEDRSVAYTGTSSRGEDKPGRDGITRKGRIPLAEARRRAVVSLGTLFSWNHFGIGPSDASLPAADADPDG